jgi:3-oxoadipate enol-lactonase
MEQRRFQLQTDDGQILVGDETGAGPPVILVHGLGFKRSHWNHQAQALLDGGYRPIRFDLRGFGDSSIPSEPYDMSRLAQDLDAVRDHFGLERLHLVGHSLGGMVAVEYALAYPDRLRSLTLASTTAHNGSRARAFSHMMARLSREGSAVALADHEFNAHVKSMLSQVVRYVAVDDMMPILARMTKRPNLARALAWQATSNFSRREDIPTISPPTFVMHGSADPIMPYTAGFLIHLGLPGSRWLPFYEGGHDLPREHEVEFTDAIISFLNDQPQCDHLGRNE